MSNLNRCILVVLLLICSRPEPAKAQQSPDSVILSEFCRAYFSKSKEERKESKHDQCIQATYRDIVLTSEKPAPMTNRKRNLNGSPATGLALNTPQMPATHAFRVEVRRKRVGVDSEFKTVPLNTVFRSGDSIRVYLSSNQSGAVTVWLKGSKGTSRVIFPHPEIQTGNQILAHQELVLPSVDQDWTFMAEPEDLVLMFYLQRADNNDSSNGEDQRLKSLVDIYQTKSNSPRPSEDAGAAIEQNVKEVLGRDLQLGRSSPGKDFTFLTTRQQTTPEPPSMIGVAFIRLVHR